MNKHYHTFSDYIHDLNEEKLKMQILSLSSIAEGFKNNVSTYLFDKYKYVYTIGEKGNFEDSNIIFATMIMEHKYLLHYKPAVEKTHIEEYTMLEFIKKAGSVFIANGNGIWTVLVKSKFFKKHQREILISFISLGSKGNSKEIDRYFKPSFVKIKNKTITPIKWDNDVFTRRHDFLDMVVFLYKGMFDEFLHKEIKKDPSLYPIAKIWLSDKENKKWKHLGSDFGFLD